MNKYSLETVKAGDVLLISGHFQSDERLEKVDRVTKTQVVIGNTKFRMVDGFAIGYAGSWNIPRARIPTPDQLEAVSIRAAKKQLVDALKSDCITAAQVKAMMAAFEAAKEKSV